MRKLKLILKIVLSCFLFLLVVTAGIFAYFAKDLPRPEEFGEREISQSTKIYDRTGEVLLYQFGEIKRTIVENQEISPYLIQATITIEDDDFYNHWGIDFKSMVRATLHNLFHRDSIQGGSTITQQLVKNAILTPEGKIPERTISRKIKEIILSLEMERKYSKEEILNSYLNQSPYGFDIYGVEQASLFYFGKSAKDLDLAESALIAALPKAPSYYWSHPLQLKARQEYILNRMVKLNHITEEQGLRAQEEKLSYASPSSNILAPHFIFYAQNELINYFKTKYGFDSNEAENFIRKSGFKVHTTLDWKLQEAAEIIIKKRVEKNEKWYLAENAALVSLDPNTGQILTMVGSRDWFDDEIEGKYNVAISPYRQPGSSFKPFVYATAFKKGYTPDTIIWDVSTNFSSAGEPYSPINYDQKFRGPVTFRQALSQSLNVPSVKVLYLAGISDSIDMAQEMGITTLKNREDYGLSLVLGGGEIKLLDEVAAYGVFATEGLKYPISSILKIGSPEGGIVEEFKPKPVRVLDPQIARLINDILSDNQTRAPIFGTKNDLTLGDRPVAAKTGTTQEFKDGWTIGYTPSLVAGVWAGNNDGSPMYKGPGIRVAAPIWNEFMRKAYQIKTRNEGEETREEKEFTLPQKFEYFNKPDPIITEKPILNGRFENEKIIQNKLYIEPHSILYYLDKSDPHGPYPKNPEKDPQFLNWEKGIEKWLNQPNPDIDKTIYQKPPTEGNAHHQENNLPSISILSPESGQKFRASDTLEVKVRADAPLGLKKIDLMLNYLMLNYKIYTVLVRGKKYEYSFSLDLDQFKLKKENPITVRLIDLEGNIGEDKIYFGIKD